MALNTAACFHTNFQIEDRVPEMRFTLAVIVLTILLATSLCPAAIPAFPGAEGGGAETWVVAVGP